MSRVSTTCVTRGRNDDGKSAAEAFDRPADGKDAVDSSDWFGIAARALYPHKAGTNLFYLTGLGDERLCQRYANGKHKPPAYFLRALLRSDQGFTWLSAVMDGSDVTWWRELQAARDLCSKYKVEIR